MTDNIYKEIADNYNYGGNAKCIVKGCTNHQKEGKFIGSLCAPCYHMITSGEIIPSEAWFAREIYDLRADLKLAKNDNLGAIQAVANLLEENKKLKKYKDVLEEVGVITFSLTRKNEHDPEQLLADIIDFHVSVATDPQVNGGYKLVKDTDVFGTAEDWKVNDD